MADPKPFVVPPRIAAKFWSKVSVSTIDKCWPWTMARRDNGYGCLGWNVSRGQTKNFLAHRVAFQVFYGPIPRGMTVDHLCRVRHCCNPWHLRLLTASENASRNGWALKTECPSGHAYTPDNTRVDARGCRSCRACENGHKRHRRRQRPLDPPLTRKDHP